MENGSVAALHRHIKKEHGFSPKDYYPLFYERRDLFDNELIEFRDIKQYFVTDFNCKGNLLEWIKSGSPEVLNYTLEILKKRAEEKKTNLIPSHVELKSLFAPNLSDYLNLFGGESNFSSRLSDSGLKMKLGVEKPELKLGELKISIDTREQSPLPFKNCQVQKLIVGDYMPSDEFFSNLACERKSLYDLAGTLTKGYDRFEREIRRAKDLGIYLVVVTESSFVDAYDFSPKNSFSQRIGGPFLFNKIRQLMTENDNVQFVFTRNREKSMLMIEKIFRMGEAAKTADLEYLKDNGDL
jgi:ERCC4-type nuclease